MKRMMIINLALTIFAWVAFLNNHAIVGFVLLALGCLLMYMKNDKLKTVKMMVMFVCLDILFTTIYENTNLNEFYELFDYYSAILSLNIAMSYQSLFDIEDIDLLLICLFSFILMLSFYLITLLLPNSWYTIFTKNNIYVLISMIFIPYCLSMTVNLIKKEVL